MDEVKISDFKGNYFCKMKILNFGGSKPESIQNPIAILWCAQFYTFWHFLIESYFKTGHSNSIQTFAIFYPKWRSITKRSFSKKMRFFWSFITNVKLMLGKVLKVSCWYLPLFLSYREKPAAGSSTPTAGHVLSKNDLTSHSPQDKS